MMDLYRKGVFNMAGTEIQGLPESLTEEVNAEEFWDSACMEIIRSSLLAPSSAYVATLDGNLKDAAVSAGATSSALAERKRLSKQRTEECHRSMTRYLVKGLLPLSTVESPWFREMIKMLNPKYRLPSREQLIHTLMPSWFSVEKKRVIRELRQVSEAAVTCDWWTSFSHDLYLTVTLHFITKGQMKQKVLRTKPVYDAQTDTVVSEQLGGVLEEFGVRDKVVAVTVDNAFGMDIAITKRQFRKLRCFARILGRAAQKVYTSNTVTRWASKIRAIVVWIKRSSTAQTVLLEKQQLLDLPLFGARCPNTVGLAVPHDGAVCRAVCCRTGRHHRPTDQTVCGEEKDGDTWKFLQESSAMDPRFKNRIDSDEIWCGVRKQLGLQTQQRCQIRRKLGFCWTVMLMMNWSQFFLQMRLCVPKGRG
ncbi:E3 SUMO-protein ligase ZBED1-like isoform X2 [Perca fluviatilis]|uniref:E3 SUMO-protein ligase ZBED1-like isoform X2 n=1 Tax=Perca fluviatilis TaxID=8168 RepID=UPI001965DAF0|nr:E3 SUMO-protein ligase ZBED1-like isoform X2 [Perca fluviatilis]